MPSPLHAPLVRRIVGGYAINRLGTWIGTIALSLAVFDHTHSAVAVAALLLSAQVLPALVVPALVARVEASPRRGELSGLYFFECLTTLALAILLSHFSLPAVLLLVALDGTAALAASALLRTEGARAGRDHATACIERNPQLRPPGGLQAAEQSAEQRVNAAINVAFSATFVAGPVLAGAIVAGAGAPTALLIDAASFLVCGLLLLDLHPHVEEAGGRSVRHRLSAARDYIGSSPVLRRLLATQAAALVFFESAAPIEVAYAKVTLGAGDKGFGLLVTVWGAGVVLGSIVFARAGDRPLGSMIAAGTFAVGVAYLGFAFAPTLPIAAIAALVGGVGNGTQWAPLISAVQRLTPPRLHGRVMGALESIGALAPAFGLALGGVLVAATSPRIAFLVVGVGAALATIVFLRLDIDGGAVERPAGEPQPGSLSAP